jgi:uncharacterized protein (DUF433 family)
VATGRKEASMVFPIELASVLSGATIRQLERWRSTRLLVPEANPYRPPLYSVRDVVALRTVMLLRAETSLQKIRTAFGNLVEYDMTDHVSAYLFAVHGRSIVVSTDDGWLDLVEHPGQPELQFYSLRDIYQPFTTNRGLRVADFRRPRQHLEIDVRRVGGWPVLENTRIGYDTIASAIDNVTIFPSTIARFYPGATEAAAIDAISLDAEVRSRAKRRAQT